MPRRPGGIVQEDGLRAGLVARDRPAADGTTIGEHVAGAAGVVPRVTGHMQRHIGIGTELKLSDG